MRDAALPRYHRLAKMPAEEGGKWSKGLQNTRSAGDSLRGFPRLGQLSPTLPMLWLRPSTDRDAGCAVSPVPPHPSYSSCSPKSRLGSAGTRLSSLSLRRCFFITSKFCQGLCKRFPENTKGRAKSGGAWMCFSEPRGLARAAFYLKHPAFPTIAASGREAADGPRGRTAAASTAPGAKAECWSWERSGITHPQLHLKKGKSQDGCSKLTGDALLPARPCALRLCKREGTCGQCGQVSRGGWLGALRGGGCCRHSPVWPGARGTRCHTGPAPCFMPSSSWLAYLSCGRSHLVPVCGFGAVFRVWR